MKFCLVSLTALLCCLLPSVLAVDATRIVVVHAGLETEKKTEDFCRRWTRGCKAVAKRSHMHMVGDACSKWDFSTNAYYASHEARVDCIGESKKGKVRDFTAGTVKELGLRFAPAGQD